MPVSHFNESLSVVLPWKVITLTSLKSFKHTDVQIEGSGWVSSGAGRWPWDLLLGKFMGVQ
jgi:hypothetical protein